MSALCKLPATAGWSKHCLAVKEIGKPCAGKPQARLDEGRLIVVSACVEVSRNVSVWFVSQLPALPCFVALNVAGSYQE